MATTTWGSPGRPVPRLLACLLCEDAAVSGALADGRVSLQRVFFDLYAAAFPCGFDRLTAVTFWTGGEGTYRVGVRILAPDGAEVARGEVELVARPGPVEGPATVAQLLYFPGLVLPVAGKYTVEVLLDDAAVHTCPLHVVDVGPAEGAEGTEAGEGSDDEQG